MIELDFTPQGRRSGEVAGLYDQHAARIRGDYACFIGSLGAQMKHPLDWWLDGPATRNPIFSDLYHEVVCLLTLRSLVEQGTQEFRVRCAHSAFANAVLAESRRLNVRVHCALPSPSERVSRRLRTLLSPWRSSLRLLLEWLTVRASGRPRSEAEQPLVLLDTFAIPGHITEDRYYPGLAEFPEAKTGALRFVPQFFNLSLLSIWQGARALRAHGDRYLLKEDRLRVTDLLWSMGHPFRLPRRGQLEARFLDIKLDQLIIADLKKRRGARCAMRGLLNYRLARALANDHVKLARTIDWFENHPMDRGWNAGFNRWYADVDRIGYVGFFPAGQSYRPTIDEHEANLLPPRFRVLGPGFRSDLCEFFADAEVDSAPAFRYPGFADQTPFAPGPSADAILVALPYYPAMCDQVMAVVVELQAALTQPMLLKSHPAHPLDRITNADTAIANGARAVTGTLDQALKQAGVMITGAQASTIIEAAAMAVPTVVVAGRGETAEVAIPDALPDSLYGVCYDATGAMALLSRFLDPERQTSRLRDAATFKATCFTAVNRETVHSLLAA